MLNFEQALHAENRRRADAMEAAMCGMGGGKEVVALIERLRKD
jgi:hypothetical protein